MPSKILRFPLNVGESDTPAILFNVVRAKYGKEPPQMIARAKGALTGAVGKVSAVAGKKLTEILSDVSASTQKASLKASVEEHIALYMVPGFSHTDQMTYEDRASGIGGSMMMNGKFPGSEGIKDILKGAIGSSGAKTASVALGATLGSMLGGNTGLATVAGGMAGNVIGGGLDELTKETQSVLRENPFITFKSVGLREWQLNWLFTPQSKQESDVVKEIIKTFRTAMYPSKDDGGYTLSFPDVFDIRFKNADLPKMPEVAVTNCSVTYNKNSNVFFTSSNAPTEIQMSLSLKELMPIYQHHIKEGY